MAAAVSAVLYVSVSQAPAAVAGTRSSDSPGPQIDTIASVDTLVEAKADAIMIDSTYLDCDIFSVMPSRMKGDAGTVTIVQSGEVRNMVKDRIAGNSFRELSGFRVRIYFSNDQNARGASVAAANLFTSKYPQYSVYRIYDNPNFKVTVGDFLTKSEALRLLSQIKQDFPAAFVVKENIRYSY